MNGRWEAEVVLVEVVAPHSPDSVDITLYTVVWSGRETITGSNDPGHNHGLYIAPLLILGIGVTGSGGFDNRDVRLYAICSDGPKEKCMAATLEVYTFEISVLE